MALPRALRHSMIVSIESGSRLMPTDRKFLMSKTAPAKSAGQKPARRRRPRRSPEEIARCLLDAAVEEFAAHGYDGARTATIAQRAGVVEPLLFKYFGSKANLFQRSIFENLDRNYNRFVETHAAVAEGGDSWSGQAREYASQQQDFLRKNARMFLSLILHESFDTEGKEGPVELSGLQEFLDKMSRFAANRLDGRADADPNLIARISFASLLACALFQDWLFPAGIADEQKIKSAVIDFVLKGADVHPTDERPNPPVA